MFASSQTGIGKEFVSEVGRTSGNVEHHGSARLGRQNTTVILALGFVTGGIATFDLYLLASSVVH